MTLMVLKSIGQVVLEDAPQFGFVQFFLFSLGLCDRETDCLRGEQCLSLLSTSVSVLITWLRCQLASPWSCFAWIPS